MAVQINHPPVRVEMFETMVDLPITSELIRGEIVTLQIFPMIETPDQLPDEVRRRRVDNYGEAHGWHVSEQIYLDYFAELGFEWVDGVLEAKGGVAYVDGVLEASVSATYLHNLLIQYLTLIFNAYLAFNPIAHPIVDNFALRDPAIRRRYREPDALLISSDEVVAYEASGYLGTAMLCVEIVSEGTRDKDYNDKFIAYERIGVPEYWLYDPDSNAAFFYRLNAASKYERQYPDEDGRYRTPLLPGFSLHVPSLSVRPPPDIMVVMEDTRRTWEAYQPPPAE